MAIFRQDIIDIDLDKGSVSRNFLNYTVGLADSKGNWFGVNLFRNGVPVDLSGASCIGLFMAPDGQNILISGSEYTICGGNSALVNLPQACYSVEGQFSLAIKVIDSTSTETMRIVDGTVVNTGATGTVDPGEPVPTYQEILALYDEMLEATISADEHNKIIEQLGTRENNLYIKETNTEGYYINPATGQMLPVQGVFLSDYIYVYGLSKIYMYGVQMFSMFNQNKEWIAGFAGDTRTVDALVTIQAGTYYIRIGSDDAYADKVIVCDYSGMTEWRPSYSGSAAARFELDYVDGLAEREYVNRFNKANIINNTYTNITTGAVSPLTGYFSSMLIYVGDLSEIMISKVHLTCFYDANQVFVSGVEIDSRQTDKTVQVPTGAVYARFCSNIENRDTAQLGRSVSRAAYAAYGEYYLPGLVLSSGADRRVIVVDKSGAGNYTSFTQAVYETVDSGTEIVVKPGTYDIIEEYVAIWGQEAVDNMSDASTSMNDFQFGVVIRNRKVTFETGAALVCDWTGHTIDNTHRFCALRVDYGVEFDGLNLDGTGLYYCIHDDYGTLDNSPFVNIYRNCRVNGQNLHGINCIGGGCHKYSRHILENCYFNNHSDYVGDNPVLSADVRYHNTYVDGAVPEVFVSNCFFSHNFNACYYGPQTTKMNVFVNNSYAPNGINKVREDPSYNVDNINLFTWNNQTA